MLECMVWGHYTVETDANSRMISMRETTIQWIRSSPRTSSTITLPSVIHASTSQRLQTWVHQDARQELACGMPCGYHQELPFRPHLALRSSIAAWKTWSNAINAGAGLVLRGLASCRRFDCGYRRTCPWRVLLSICVREIDHRLIPSLKSRRHGYSTWRERPIDDGFPRSLLLRNARMNSQPRRSSWLGGVPKYHVGSPSW